MIWLSAIGLCMFVVVTAFPVVFTLGRVKDLGIWMPLSARVVGRIWYVLGVPADIGYNLVPGTIQFRELPRELLFSSRIQRHVHESKGWRRGRALRWAEFLNAVAENHIKAP